MNDLVERMHINEAKARLAELQRALEKSMGQGLTAMAVMEHRNYLHHEIDRYKQAIKQFEAEHE